MKNTGTLILIVTSALIFSLSLTNLYAEESQENLKGVALDGTNIIEEECQVLSSNGDEVSTLREVPGMHVLNRTKEDPLVIFAIENVKIKGVVCWRSPAKFAENDFLVPENLGYPLYIKYESEQESQNRTFILEKIGGSFRIRLLSGPDITSQEKLDLIKVLSNYEKKIKNSSGT